MLCLFWLKKRRYKPLCDMKRRLKGVKNTMKKKSRVNERERERREQKRERIQRQGKRERESKRGREYKRHGKR